MKIGVNLSINVSNIDKAKLFDGKKGKYLDATVFIDTGEADQYGNHGMIAQSATKEERDANIKGAILGNAKIFWNDSGSPQQSSQPQQESSSGGDDGFGDIPF